MTKITLVNLNVALFLYLGFLSDVWAQDRARYPFFADYFQQQILYNPAFTGTPDQPLFMAAGRFENRSDQQKPLSLVSYVQGLIRDLNMGVGISAQYHRFDDRFMFDNQLFPTNKKLLRLMVASSYPISIGEFKGLRMGLNIGIIHYKSNEVYMQGINPQPSQLYNERFFKLDMDLAVGLHLERLKMGIALQHLSEPKFRFSDNGIEQRFTRQAFFTATYRISVANWLDIEPSTQLNLPATNASIGIGNPPYIDLGLILRYANSAYLAIHYKINDDNATSNNQYFYMPRNLYPMSIGAGTRWSNMQLSSTIIFAKEPKFSRIEVGLSYFLQQDNEEEE